MNSEITYHRNLFEVFFSKQMLVPYSHLDNFLEYSSDFSLPGIYMVLERDRLIFKDIIFKRVPIDGIVNVLIDITYKNCVTKEIHRMEDIYFCEFPLPEKALHLKIVSDDCIEVGINEEYREKHPELDIYKPRKINIYSFINMANINPVYNNYNLLYIGKANALDKRILNHEKIQKITRDIMKQGFKKEMFIWLMKTDSNFQINNKIDHLN